jgi:hypothetical protein
LFEWKAVPTAQQAASMTNILNRQLFTANRASQRHPATAIVPTFDWLIYADNAVMRQLRDDGRGPSVPAPDGFDHADGALAFTVY